MADAMQSLDSFRDQIRTSVETYQASLKSWTAKRKVYESLLQLWSDYSQLRSNPVDTLRLEFMDAEIKKQNEKLTRCQENLRKFAALEDQMKALAMAIPVPSEAEALPLDVEAEDSPIMEIREDLDEDGNVISSSVRPQSLADISKLSTILEDQAKVQETKSVEVATGNMPDPAQHTDSLYEPPFIPSAAAVRDTVKKERSNQKEKKTQGWRSDQKNISREAVKLEPVSEEIIERNAYESEAVFNVREAQDGELEIVNDPQGFAIGVLPQGLAEMTEIIDELDWDKDNDMIDNDGEESEDEFGRAKHHGMIPLPGLLSRPSSSQESRQHVVEHQRRNSAEEERPSNQSARGKKKLVFADTLVQGPSRSSQVSPPRSVLKKNTSYPITDNCETDSPPVTPIIAEPKVSRFRLERSSTDTRIAARHALPSQQYQQTLEEAVSDNVIERKTTPIKDVAEPSAVTKHVPPPSDNHDQLFPRKINLAGMDLAPSDGTTKAAMSIPKLSEEQLAAIRKKRELMGKKHKRRKSADPSYPVRSASWDESQSLPKPHRRPSSGEDELPGESLKTIRLARVKELLKAQDDIAWANAPISPDEHNIHNREADPMAQAGDQIKEAQERKLSEQGVQGSRPIQADLTMEDSPKDIATPPIEPSQSMSGRILSPRPMKPPTPERRGSYQSVPSPLRQEISMPTLSKEVQFTADVIKKLEPLMENAADVAAPVTERKGRKLPPRQPRRKTSVDPQNIIATPGSPPPEGRHPGPLRTEEDGAVSHYMVRATNKSPPPHIAIHDLIGETPEAVRQAVKEEVMSPTPRRSNGHAYENHAMSQNQSPDRGTKAAEPSSRVVNDIIEHHTDDTTLDIEPAEENNEDEIDEVLHRREIAQEYHRLRQRMIASNGGYLKEDEDDGSGIVPLTEDGEEDVGPSQRISRFKAARLGPRTL